MRINVFVTCVCVCVYVCVCAVVCVALIISAFIHLSRVRVVELSNEYRSGNTVFTAGHPSLEASFHKNT